MFFYILPLIPYTVLYHPDPHLVGHSSRAAFESKANECRTPRRVETAWQEKAAA